MCVQSLSFPSLHFNEHPSIKYQCTLLQQFTTCSFTLSLFIPHAIFLVNHSSSSISSLHSVCIAKETIQLVPWVRCFTVLSEALHPPKALFLLFQFTVYVSNNRFSRARASILSIIWVCVHMGLCIFLYIFPKLRVI